MQWDWNGCTDNYSHPRNIEHPGSIRNLHIFGTIERGCFSYLVGMKYRSSRFIQSQNVRVDAEFPHLVFQSPPVALLLLPCRTWMRLLCLRRRQQHPASASKFGATRTSTVCAPPWTRHGEGVGEIEGMILPTSSTRSFDRWRSGGSLLVRSFTLGESHKSSELYITAVNIQHSVET